MKVTHKPGLVRTVIIVLSGALQLADDDGRLAANPAHRLKLPRQMKNRKKFLTHQRVAALAAAVDEKPKGEGFGLLVFVLAYCGLRWGELAGLRVRDLDFSRRRLNVRETMVEVDEYFEVAPPKNYEERSIPVPEFIMDRLAEHIRMKALDDHVFVSSRNGSVMRNRTFRRYWFDEAAEAIGVPGLTPHELRHTCASLAVSVGANVKAVQLMLGHASAAITLDVYADLFDDDLGDVAVALNMAAQNRLVISLMVLAYSRLCSYLSRTVTRSCHTCTRTRCTWMNFKRCSRPPEFKFGVIHVIFGPARTGKPKSAPP